MTFDRRQFLTLMGLGGLAWTDGIAAPAERPPRILLRSSWQTVNIGDIAHTPGLLSILETHLPEAEIVLWPSNVDNGVAELLLARFPKLTITAAGSPQLQEAFRHCDFLLHGSGASLVAEQDIVRWRDATGKPYGVYGITLPAKKSSSTAPTPPDAIAKTVAILSAANFVFFRDSHSLQYAKSLGVACPVMEFAPDAAFACDLRDDPKSDAFLAANGLQLGKFLCCIPRLRYTPYWTIKDNVNFDEVKHLRNEQMKEHDHAALRKSIIEIVKHTDMNVLVCPEDRTQMKVGKEMIYDRLPAETLKRVVWRPDYWLTGEAISTYVRSAGLFGNEMHSPIMCIGHGVPAIVCRFDEQTSKGYMWQDIGLGDWLFDLDDPAQVEKIVPTVLALATDPPGSRKQAEQARQFVQQRQRETMDRLKTQVLH